MSVLAGSSSTPLLALAVLGLVPGASAQQLVRLGDELQINGFTVNDQRYPSVAVDADGDFVAAWVSTEQDGASFGIFARRFSSHGSPLAAEFQVNEFTVDSQHYPSVAVDAGGDFVVTWQSERDGDAYGIFARRFSSDGTPLGMELQVNSYTASYQRHPSVASDADGDFVVVWQSYYQDGSYYGVFGRRFSSDGTPLAEEFQVNSSTVLWQRYPSLAVDTDGDFVVVWQGLFSDGDGYGLVAQRFSSDGTPVAGEFQINSYTTGDQKQPRVVAESDGDFVITWESDGQDGSQSGVFARRFSSLGEPITAELRGNTYTSDQQLRPSVAIGANDDFILVWQSNGQDTSGYGIFARRFSNAGDPLAAEFQVNSFTSDSQLRPTASASAEGEIVVAWQSSDQDGSLTGVFAQRLGVPVTLDVDGDGSVQPLTDGILTLRYMFGFNGSTLVAGAVSAGCTRCDAASIEQYLAGLT